MKKKHLVGLFLGLGICFCGFLAFSICYHNMKNDNAEEPKSLNTSPEIVANRNTQELSSSGNAGESSVTNGTLEQDLPEDEMEPENRQKSKEAIHAESMAKIPAIFILKIKEGQVIVYNADGVTMYETTGITVDHLPYSVLRELIFGKPITTFDELYNFLENYSS